MSDLIIKGAKGISDGLYVIKDGELFKYKPNRNTVYTARCYRITDRPKGKWVKDICKYDKAYHFKCSICDEWNGLSVEEWNWKPNFCPNCGADMRGEDE